MNDLTKHKKNCFYPNSAAWVCSTVQEYANVNSSVELFIRCGSKVRTFYKEDNANNSIAIWIVSIFVAF